MVRFVSRLLAPLALAAALAAVPPAGARAAEDGSKPDAALQKALQELGYRYHVLANGMVVVEVPSENGAITPVLVTPGQQDSLGEGFRMVMIPVASFSGSVPANVEAEIKRLNADLPFGQLRVLKTEDGKNIVVLLTQLPANAPANMLGNCLRDVAKIGNKVEAALKKSNAAA